MLSPTHAIFAASAASGLRSRASAARLPAPRRRCFMRSRHSTTGMSSKRDLLRDHGVRQLLEAGSVFDHLCPHAADPWAIHLVLDLAVRREPRPIFGPQAAAVGPRRYRHVHVDLDDLA